MTEDVCTAPPLLSAGLHRSGREGGRGGGEGERKGRKEGRRDKRKKEEERREGRGGKMLQCAKEAIKGVTIFVTA